ncbi:MAG: aldose 1-epimerase family protein [Eubacteriales bacterium]|nr:aldose 1-epimerase family protein [Eubacteriales bacterium]
MEKRELYQYVGSMQQVAYIRQFTCEEGRSRGMKLFDVKNECLQYQVQCDKCLDVSGFSYKGVNLNFLSKPGLQGRNHYDTNGAEALRSIMGGLFFTAGLENICAPYKNAEGDYPMHGRIRTTPAEQIASEEVWTEKGLTLRVAGTMREAELFGENLVLRRTIETVVGEKSVKVTDEIENEAFREEPLMLLYHINLGYPFLTPDMKFYIPTRSVTARDEAAKGHEKDYDRMEPPKANEPEYVFLHDLKATPEKETWVLAVNPTLKLGLKIAYNMENLPYFMEWKSVAAGDYVVGLEPANSSVYGRGYHEKRGDLHKLKPFAKETNQLTFTVLDGDEEIQEAIREFTAAFGD